jgi:hypothetical protein
MGPTAFSGRLKASAEAERWAIYREVSMAGFVKLRLGDLFAGPADLIVLPCSTGGTITRFVANPGGSGVGPRQVIDISGWIRGRAAPSD